MKVADLEGAKLDYWVAKAEGFDARIEIINQFPYCVYGGWKRFFPSSDWLDGGPIIERERIKLLPPTATEWGWYACSIGQLFEDGSPHMAQGPTPLIAAMRAYVASKFGEEVDDE